MRRVRKPFSWPARNKLSRFCHQRGQLRGLPLREESVNRVLQHQKSNAKADEEKPAPGENWPRNSLGPPPASLHRRIADRRRRSRLAGPCPACAPCRSEPCNQRPLALSSATSVSL